MAAIEQVVPNLLGGVSQQPDPLKLPGQVKTANNVYLDPTFGALKRPGSELMLQVNDVPADAKWFPILRDEQEHYLVAIWRSGYAPGDQTTNDTPGTLQMRVYDVIQGRQVTVSYDANEEYLQGDVDFKELRHLTIGDYTLITNPRVQPTTFTQGERRTAECIITIGQAGYGTQYIVDFSEEDGGQQSRWQVQEMQAQETYTRSTHEQPEWNGETLVTDWNGTGLSFRVRVEARSFVRDGGKKYGHQYTTFVTLLVPGNSTTPFPDQIRVDVSGREWKVYITKQKETKAYANLGTAQFTTAVDPSGGGASTADIVTGLTASINSLTGFSATSTGNVIRVRRSGTSNEFVVSARGGTSGDGLTAFKYSVDNLAMLPTECWNGYRVIVRNTGDTEADDYYVEFVTDVEGADVPGPGRWRETHAQGEGGGLNDRTMPHVLVRKADGTFQFTSLEKSQWGKSWGRREVGSLETNPDPSFTNSGAAIYGMFMYKNRLGFLTEDAVVMSQVGDYFNFYATSGVALSDADPIDLATSDTRPVRLRGALTSDSGAILFGNQAQFRLSTQDDAFGPKTARLDKISNYIYDSDAWPVQTGVSMMYATNMGTYSSVYEMATDSTKGTPVIEENTRVVPRFLPSGLTWAESSMNNDTVLFGSRELKDVYVFRFFNEGPERSIAGWSKWTYPGKVQCVGCYGELMYLALRDDDGNTVITRSYLLDQADAPITAGEFNYLPRMDNIVQYPAQTTPRNKINLLQLDYNLRESKFTLSQQWGVYPCECTLVYTDVDDGEFEQFTVGTSRVFYAQKNRPFRIGLTYDMKLELPNFYVKTEKRPDRITDVMVQGVYFDLYQSSGIDVTVNVTGYDPYQGYLTPINANAYNADAAAMRVSGTEYLGMASPGSQSFITLSSTNPYPSGLISYSFQGIYNKRGYAPIR